MPLLHRPNSPRRLRAAGPHGQGAASSLLRLSQQAATRLPSGQDVAGWVSRAAGWLGTQQAEPAFAASAFAASAFASDSSSIITRLLPSHELGGRR